VIEIWQYKTRKCRSEVEEEKMITQNFALVKYQPQEWFDLRDVHKPK
jgi:hypothetical protein